MTSSQQPEDLIAAPPPTILVEEVESDSPKESERTQGEKTPQSSPIRSSRLQVPETRPRRSTRKRTASQISDTEAASFEPADAMSSQTSKHKSEGGSKKHHGSSSKKDRKSSKSDDWSEVTEPEERRRIQNRIAQRKFRESSPTTGGRIPSNFSSMQGRRLVKPRRGPRESNETRISRVAATRFQHRMISLPTKNTQASPGVAST